MSAARSTAEKSSPARNRMIAAIQIQWKQMRPDLRHSPQELREERLAFIANTLGLKRELNSMCHLSDRQLGKVLDALKAFRSQPALPHSGSQPAQPARGGEVIHLATAEQVYAIGKLFTHLSWGEEARRAFLRQRFNRESPSMLRVKQAHSLIRILLNVACSRELKERGEGKMTREMIRRHIPVLKERLGIDRCDY